MDFKTLSCRVFHSPFYFVAFGLGSGLSPVAPGTCGTIAAIPFYIALSYFSWPIYILLVGCAFGVGIYITDKVSQDLKVHDFSGIVWDEFVGYWITMFLAPSGWIWWVVGLTLFRLFDVWKPYPIGYVDKHLKGGLGIMMDDVMAGIFAWIAMRLIALGVH